MGGVREKLVFEPVEAHKLDVGPRLFCEGMLRGLVGELRVRRGQGLKLFDAVGEGERKEQKLQRRAHLIPIRRPGIRGEKPEVSRHVDEGSRDESAPGQEKEPGHARAAARFRYAGANEKHGPRNCRAEGYPQGDRVAQGAAGEDGGRHREGKYPQSAAPSSTRGEGEQIPRELQGKEAGQGDGPRRRKVDEREVVGLEEDEHPAER